MFSPRPLLLTQWFAAGTLVAVTAIAVQDAILAVLMFVDADPTCFHAGLAGRAGPGAALAAFAASTTLAGHEALTSCAGSPARASLIPAAALADRILTAWNTKKFH